MDYSTFGHDHHSYSHGIHDSSFTHSPWTHGIHDGMTHGVTDCKDYLGHPHVPHGISATQGMNGSLHQQVINQVATAHSYDHHVNSHVSEPRYGESKSDYHKSWSDYYKSQAEYNARHGYISDAQYSASHAASEKAKSDYYKHYGQ
ncbi:hypothetical protein [Calothrix sp. NIES-3974]|uniref:hypothetical protein n=1 Tax=Calothrix sp. NIES-3974 TaxID=2005462 RepID=UPI000B61E944|nr:hypothetical protein [Calothrix sp. NIES-3974]BAZ04322.1 hypothetical protein NIES3974_09550 [Calothrix sp. NIES-3974]